jgi:hypothetical protein
MFIFIFSHSLASNCIKNLKEKYKDKKMYFEKNTYSKKCKSAKRERRERDKKLQIKKTK